MNNNNQNGFQEPNNWQQPNQGSVSGQNFTHNMPQQAVNEQSVNQSAPQQPVQNVHQPKQNTQQPVQNAQQPVWNNQMPNQNQHAFGGQAHTTNTQPNNVQQGMRQTNQFVNNNTNPQQNYQGNGQAFQQTGTNQQFNQGNNNQQHQQSENMNFQQGQPNMYGQSMNASTTTKLMAKKHSGLYLATIILAGVGALYYLSMKSYSDELRWFFDSAWFSNLAADIWACAALSLIAVAVLTFLGWLKGNKWLILAALITSVVAIYFYAYIGIVTLVILIILFVSMIKDSKKQKNFY